MTTGTDLLGDGPSITLIDGSTIPLRYSMRALALLEARYGSVVAIQNAIDSTGKGAAFGPVIQLVGAGCLGVGGFDPHLREHQDAKGERRVTDITYRRRRDGADLADLLHPGLINEYVDAFGAAFSKAVQTLGGPGNDDGATAAPTTTVSPGLTSTGSPSVPSTFLPAPSGT